MKPDFRPRDMRSFRLLVDLVRKRTGLQPPEARALLHAIADTVTREALMRRRQVVWPRLGRFRYLHQPTRLQRLTALPRRLPSSPEAVVVPSQLILAFRASRSHAVLRGVQP